MALFRDDDALGAGAGERVVAAAGPALAAPTRAGDHHRLAGRRGRRRHRPARAADRIRRGLRRRPDHATPAPGRRHPPRPSAQLPTERTADERHRGAGRDRPPRARRPEQRPDDGPRLRPRHDRPADVHQRRLHRRRCRHPARRHRLGPRAVRLRVVGAAAAARRVGVDALAAARERSLARPQHPRGQDGPTAHGLCLWPGHRARGRQGGAPVRPRRLAAGPVHHQPAAHARPAIRRHPPARTLARRSVGDRVVHQRFPVVDARPQCVCC